MHLVPSARWIIYSAAIFFVVPAPAGAQAPFSASLTGTVRDASAAVLVGASVTIAAPTLIGGPQTVTTNAAGVYRFGLLPAGTYDVVVEAAGFRPLKQSGVRVSSGAVVTIDAKLSLADVTSEVEVRGGSPVVDVKSAAVPVRLDSDQLSNLPTVRSLSSVINLAPGVAADVAYGGSQEGNEILIDGVRTTDPLFQDPLLRANYNWLQEVSVVALGAPAEFGGFTGAAAHAVLRSGSNRFSGLGEYWTTRPSWLDTNTADLSATLQRQFLSRQLLEWHDSSAQVGGPILRDRLWFFTGIQYGRHNDTPAGFTGPGSRDEHDVQLIVKPTASISPAVRLDGFIEHGRHHVYGEYIDANFPIEASNDVWNPQTSWNAHLTWTLSDDTVVEARHGGYDAFHAEDPHPPATLAGPAPHYDLGTGLWSQNTNAYFKQDSRVQTVSTSLAHHIDRGGRGGHDLKVGVEYETTRGHQDYRYPGGRTYYDLFGEPYELEIWDGDGGTATTSRTVLHGQDSWTAGNRLSVGPGVRIEWNRGSVPNQPNVFQTTTMAPRIGVAWDVTGNHRTVARFHYGYYYDPIFSSRIMSEDRSDVHASILYEIVGPDELVEESRTSTQDRFAIDPEIRHSHVKQLILGFEHELFADFSLQTQYIRRRFDTYMGLIDTGSIYEPIQLRDPGPDGRLGTPDDGALLDVFNLTNPGNRFDYYTNPTSAFNRYDAFQVVGRKRYSDNWQLQASYTWSNNRGTVGNRWHVNAARFDLGNPGRFVNPNTFINAFGQASFDPTHEAKVLGTYRLPQLGGVIVSGVYRYTTGQAWGRTATITGFAQGSQRIRIEPQGTRRLDAINQLDLRVEKTAPVPRLGTAGLFVDVFNVWNQGVPNSEVTNAVNDLSGARFGEPNAWVDPRMLRVGVRLTF